MQKTHLILFTFSLLCFVGCDGCRDNASALLTGELPALPRITSWDTHLRAFSMVSAKAPLKPLRYQVEASCPLRYAFAWVRRSNASVMQREKKLGQMSVMQVFGAFSVQGKGDRWVVTPSSMRLTRRAPGSKEVLPISAKPWMSRGPLVLKTDGLAWELAQGKHPLWKSTSQEFSLSRFWPELSRSTKGHARDVKKDIPGGWLKARSYTKHWLMLRGERVGVMVEQMQVKRQKVQLDHDAEYAMLTRGHLLYARFRHRSWVLDPGRGDQGRTETVVEGELRLRKGCHKLRLAPFLASK